MSLSYSAFNTGLAMRSRIANSRLLLGAPQVKLKYDKIICVHVPKTGGTSLLRQFRDLLRSGLHLNYVYDAMNTRECRLDLPKGKTMVIGHFHPTLYDGVDGFRMTFLRHPVDNVLSTYAFWKTARWRGNPIHRRFLIERPSVLEFSRYPGIVNLLSETFFGDYDMRRFDFIGFAESRAADLAHLSQLIGANLSADVHHNKTHYSPEDEDNLSDEKVRNSIAHVIRQDIRFYESIRAQRFDSNFSEVRDLRRSTTG